MDAVALLSEWVQNIGSQAGLTDNVHILSGAVGVPESRLELEVDFSTLAELEQFWASIPPQDHKAWSQRAQHLIIDGSPKWDIYRTVAVSSAPSSPAAASLPQAVKSQALKMEAAPASAPAQRDSLLDAATAGGVLLGSGKYTFQALEEEPKSQEVATEDVKGELEQAAAPDGRKMMLDWKGDPMYVNPGDKLPF
ncbi:g3005 [Coccomyxa viridis]|uniref:G3005 protein n=1 Tax=Coccomyxa viridis TaxID=1274662 RepID=A0ABP1FLS2_9CHLO